MFTLLKKANPVLVYLVIGVAFLAALVLRFLFKTLYGAFVLALIAYFYCEQIFGVPPMTIRELVLLIMSLDAEYKVGILSSLITVIGFVYAFHMSAESWRRQMREEQKFKAANEIEDFFQRVIDSSYVLERYAEGLVSIVEMRVAVEPDSKIETEIRILEDKTKAFREARAEISRYSVDVYGLIQRNDGPLSVGWGLKASAQFAAKEISKISEHMWFHTPVADFDEDAWAVRFIASIDDQAIRDFIVVVEGAQTQIIGAAGSIKGYLHSYVWSLSGAGLLSWLSDAKGKIEAFKDFQNKQ